jgi:hypothetical protein
MITDRQNDPGRITLHEVAEAEQMCRFAVIAGTAVLNGGRAPVDLHVALRGVLAAANHAGNVLDSIRAGMEGQADEAAEAKGKAKPARTTHRHKFYSTGICDCGKTKSAAGRKAANPPPPVLPNVPGAE